MNLDAHQLLTAIATAVVKSPPPTPDRAAESQKTKKSTKKAEVSDRKLGSILGWTS